MPEYIVNLVMYSGSDFSHDYFLSGASRGPLDISNFTFSGYLAKYPGSIFANDSTSTHTYWDYLPITCTVTDGVGGVLNIQVPKEVNRVLEEGKYTYAVSMVDDDGNTYAKIISGLVFVQLGMNALTGTVGPAE